MTIQIIDPEERFDIELEGAAFTIRRLDSATLTALERRHAAAPERAGRNLLNDDALDYVLLEWRGVESPISATPVPCTRPNKLALPTAVKLKILAAAQQNTLPAEG